MKSTSRNVHALKEVRPNAPRSKRMGRSRPISFSRSLSRHFAENRKSENRKPGHQNGLGVTEVRPKATMNHRTGQSAQIRMRFLLRQASATKSKIKQNVIGLEKVGANATGAKIEGRIPPISLCCRSRQVEMCLIFRR